MADRVRLGGAGACRTGPGIRLDQDAGWLDALIPLPDAVRGAVTVNRGWDLGWERDQWQRAVAAGHDHVSVRLFDDEVLVGPRWVPETDSGCAGCAELRGRVVVFHPLVDALAQPTAVSVPRRPFLLDLLGPVLENLADRPLRPGELYAVGARMVRRHRVLRSFDCPVCGPDRRRPAGWRPEPLVLASRPASPNNPARAASGDRLLDGMRLRDRLVDARFGPITKVTRESRAPFAMSIAALPDSMAMGYGRAATFADAEPVAVLEAYERLGGFPNEAPIATGLSYRDIADHAVDPATLGQYTAEQLAHPSSRVDPVTPGTAMDWVWGHDLASGEPMLVPADIGFYQYEYRYKLDRFARRRENAEVSRHFFHDSSSGCALGSSLEEATLHSLLELTERDAFLLAWHRARPLPVIATSSITDPLSRRLLELIEARGFEPNLLAATQDIDLPVVWGVAVNRVRPFPATYSAAGSGVDPTSVVRNALWELAQLVTEPVDWDRAAVERMVDDPWLMEKLDDHLRLYALPERRDRVATVLNGPQVPLAEAFPGWPGRFRDAAGGDVRGALEYVAGLFGSAGLDRIVVVNQSTREHADLGVVAAKAVVPGITPLCFGHAHQRLAGLPRLEAALAATGQAHRRSPYDPHPFP